jgi:hypothetical protein
MKKFLPAVAGLSAILFVLSPMAFGASAEQVLEKCKAQADDEEISDADLKTWVSNCMKDEGVSAADAKPLVDQEFSADEQLNSKSSMPE